MKSSMHRLIIQISFFFCVGLLLAGSAGAQPLFTDVTEQVGLQMFTARNARNVVFADYDNDGFQDVFLTENAVAHITQIITFPRRFGLFHNTGDGRFVDQTALIPSDLHLGAGAAGAVFGDYDNDGDEDLFLPVIPQNVFLRNDRGRFVQVDVGSDLADSLIADGALWLDYDQDGYLDLYVSNRIAGPSFAWPFANRLLRNNGDETFSDQTAIAGLDGVFEPVRGGASGGMAAADFNNDGWPDLYLGVHSHPNRLFLNDGQGRFVDATTGEIGDEGEAFSVAIGDIDNDGNLDIFQASGGTNEEGFRSLMLSNLGDGQFLDVTEGVGLGLSVLGANTGGTSFADIDNDGDLDLVIGLSVKDSARVHFLLLNDGSGTFVDQTAVSGIDPEEFGMNVTFGDYDEDGFVDLWYSTFARELTALYRNNGMSQTADGAAVERHANHWLRVELVGVESNRNGIGTRLIATSGDQRQTREILGGLGRHHDEQIAHFGLGEHTQVDRLDIRWPSGQVDVFPDLPADQKIRIIEGRGEYYAILPTVWEVPPPAVVEFDQTLNLRAVVRPALFEPSATIASITADLSGLGGPQAVPLVDQEDGTYLLEAEFVVGGTNVLRAVEVFIEQETTLGLQWINLSRNIAVSGDPNTAILEQYAAGRPESFALAQNYPNPFNSGTVIRFDLPAAQAVELAVYNLSGQQVTTLVTGPREAGTYSVRWDGRDDDGRELASGVYLYRLRTGTQVETRKLLLIR